MQHLVFAGRRRLEWQEAPDPQLRGPLAAVVRPVAVARCDADLGVVAGRAARLGWAVATHATDPAVRSVFGPAPFRSPFPLGHECVAEVVACGSEVTTLSPGHLVVVPFQISCGHCARCRAGLTGYCASVPPGSMYGFGAAGGGWGGMIADLVGVPYAEAMLVPVPSGVDPAAVASASDNLPDAWRAVGPPLRQHAGAKVLVVGGGARSIGLYATAIAVALGSPVHYVDRSGPQRQLAESLGATVSDRPPAPDRNRGYPVTVDASSRPAGLAAALAATDAGGTCTSAGIYFRRRTGVPLFSMYARGLTLRTGFANARADLPAVLDLVRSHRLRPERITTLVAAWDDAPTAMLDPTSKVVLTRARTTPPSA